MKNYREIAWEMAQKGEMESAMAAWTMAYYEKPDPVIAENLQKADSWMRANTVKSGFLSDDTLLGEHLLELQKSIHHEKNLKAAIDNLLHDWFASPHRNVYSWALEQIRNDQDASPERVLILSAIAEHLENTVNAYHPSEPEPVPTFMRPR